MRILHKKLCLLIALLISSPLSILAQNKTITGTVRDAMDVVIGASVVSKGTSAGTITDLNGYYSISVPASVKQLTFSFVGYENQTVTIGNQTKIDVTLKESSLMLDEVVAIGYAKVKRKDLTGASVSVGGNELKIAPVTTAAQALTGKAAGVNITTQSGAPGADINITVRGGTSITQSSEPLYIVDGFQMDNGLQNVDINDIETIDVLKDASSTAIYGARGSNGVILITTKSGKTGKTEVNYNGYYSFEKLGKKLDVLNVLDYVKYQYEFQLLAGKESSFASMFGGDINSSDFYTGAYSRIESEYGSRDGIDWQDLVFGGTGLTQNHNVNVNGGNEKTKFMLSYNYTEQDGIMDKHGYTKNSIRTKINHELWKGARLDFSSNYQDTKIEGGGSLGGALKMTILQPVTGGARFTNEQFINSDISDEMLELDSQYDIYNPIITNDAVTNIKKTRQFAVNSGLEFDFLKDFMWRSAGSYMWQQARQDYWDDGRTKTAENNGGPYGYRNNDEKYSYQITNTLSWGHGFNGHQLNALLGQETYYTESMGLDNSYYEFPENNFGLNDVSMSTSDKNTSSSSKSKSSLVSFFGRASYNYKGRYMANATLRADGSSKFANGNKWGYFPSASAAWRISEESFMVGQNIIDNLKLRVGYGTSGNCNIDNNMYATDYKSSHYTVNNEDITTLVPGSIIGNKKLKWEKTTSANIGLDVSVFNSRLNLGLDFYNNESDNLLIKNSIPTSTGYSYQYQNIGSVRNRGFEIVLNSMNIKKKSFKWTTDFNISFNRSKVLSIYGDGADDYFLQNYESRIDYKIQVGKPLGQFYGYKYDGVYTTDDFVQDGTSYKLKDGVARAKAATVTNIKPGDVKYKTTAGETDANGNPVWSSNDRTVIGNSQPDFQGGLTNTFTYKGFDLTVFMNFVVGNKIFNMSSQRFIGPYLPNQNTLTVMNSRFKLVDPNTGKESTDLARLAEMNPQQYAKNAMWSLHSDNKIAITDALDYYLEDGSFLRIGTITLGYTLPKIWLQKIKINNARFYCTLNNVYTFTGYDGYDPEVSATSSLLTAGVDNSSFPRAKSYVIGLNLSF
ncbi:MAG: TonB dependent receptor [Bacteroidetes bacterium]|nr:TonB dependent receptor [Bacteroidota bacterium]